MENEFEVRDAKAEAVLARIGDSLRECMPKGYGFMLMIFSYGAGGNLFYASSGKRDDVVRMMQEFIAKQEQEPMA